MTFWDGSRWIRDGAPRPPTSTRTLADWLATGVALIMLVLLAMPSARTVGATQLSMAPASGAAGAAFVLQGSGFPAGAKLTVTFGGKRLGPGSTRVSGAGDFTLQLTVPAVSPGAYTVAASATVKGNAQRSAAGSNASATFSVVAGPTAPTASPSVVSTPSPTPTPTPTQVPTPDPTAQPPDATPVATPTPTPDGPGAEPGILFGQGPEAPGVIDGRLYGDAPLNMLSSWYNGPNDLSWMTDWEDDLVPQAYARGEALHLIVYSGDPGSSQLTTQYGPACGKAYPLSARFADDMQQLAHTFRPRGAGDRLYVTVFTEFQTYPCSHNEWLGSENYYRALKDNYRAALAAFHAVGGRVSLGWGGWQARWDDPAKGGGRSLITKFADVLAESDFQSFQAMQSDSNVSDIREMTRLLGAYGPVMVAHYGPDNRSLATTNADLHDIFTDAFVDEVRGLGLFAFSFMHADLWDGDDALYTFTRDAVRRYGAE